MDIWLTYIQVENLLDLKQKQANVDESRLARWEAEVTQSQSRAVMVFTIFTVMSVEHSGYQRTPIPPAMPANPSTLISFLPLSFFTSLFGINAREWSGEPENLTLRTMLVIAGKPSSTMPFHPYKLTNDIIISAQAQHLSP